MFSYASNRREQGAVIVTVALLLLFLMGFMGIALDFGRLFIVKGELQTAMDSCALAASQELDGQPDALVRAVNAGMTAGNMNRVDLQSATWRNRGQIAEDDITFRSATYQLTTSAADARYAQCEHTQTGVQMWLLNAMGAFNGDRQLYPDTQTVLARAVATRASAQTACVIPVALIWRNETPPNYGFQVGEWVTLINEPRGALNPGNVGWANLDESSNARSTRDQLEAGTCIGPETDAIGNVLDTPGVQTAVAEAWNYRFGIYKNTGDPSVNTPDFTGYAYTTKNWPSAFNAYDGTPGAGADPTAENFVTKRQKFASCADTGTRVRGAGSCESITDLNLNSFQRLATPGVVPGGHRQYGSNRRLVTVPVVRTDSEVIDYACMLLLQPLSVPVTSVQLEYRGHAGDPGSPCTTSGVPGGSAGPLVSVLVE